jgi:hypothetical protein
MTAHSHALLPIWSADWPAIPSFGAAAGSLAVKEPAVGGGADLAGRGACSARGLWVSAAGFGCGGL